MRTFYWAKQFQARVTYLYSRRCLLCDLTIVDKEKPRIVGESSFLQPDVSRQFFINTRIVDSTFFYGLTIVDEEKGAIDYTPSSP